MVRATSKSRAAAAPAARRASRPAAPPPPPALDLNDGGDDYLTPDMEFAAFLEEYDPTQGGEVRVYREGASGIKDMEFLARFAIQEFDPVNLQQPPFNGGKFRIHVRSKEGLLRNFQFKCAPIAAPIAAPVPAGPAPELVTLIAGISEGFKALSTQLAGMAGPRGAGMGVKETIEMMTALQTFSGSRAPAAAPADPLDMMQKFLTLQKAIGGDRVPLNADGDTDSGAVLLKAIEVFGQPLARLAEIEISKRSGTPPAAAAVPALPAPKSPPSPAGQAEPPTEEDDMSLKIKIVKPVFLLAARTDADVETYAEMLLDHFTDDEITKYIDAPDWKAEFLKLMPEAETLMPWFERLRGAVLAALTAEVDGSTVAPGGKTDGKANAA